LITLKNKDIVQLNEFMIRLAILNNGLREFWVMLCFACPHMIKCLRCPTEQKCFIEEYDWKNDAFLQVEDDNEIEDLVRFSELHKLTDLKERSGEMVECGLAKIIFRPAQKRMLR
jgi:hypothetical protein